MKPSVSCVQRGTLTGPIVTASGPECVKTDVQPASGETGIPLNDLESTSARRLCF